ncbi:MAG: tyrosine-protein phosphatase [Elusimicrobiota bacterium]
MRPLALVLAWTLLAPSVFAADFAGQVDGVLRALRTGESPPGLPLAVPAAPEAVALTSDLPNFARVDESYYRSAQPTVRGLRMIAELGVRTVLNLRDDSESYEKVVVEGFGMRYIHMPMSAWKRPTGEQIDTFLSLMRDPEAAPMLVHCARGADRTGVLSAIRRMEIDGWTAMRAAKEMIAFKTYSPPLVLYVFEYYHRMDPKHEIPDLSKLAPRLFSAGAPVAPGLQPAR